MLAVKAIFRVMAVCLALLWVPASGHCRIEALTGLDFLACSGADSESQDHTDAASDADHCGDDVCATVENGHYKSDLRPVTAPPPCIASILPVLLLEQIDAANSGLLSVRPEAADPPLELAASWRFASRSAPAPRAPSFVS